MARKTTNFITYQELRDKALDEDIPDNKVSIGIWAQNNRYYKKRIQKDNKVKIYYFKNE